MPYTFGQAKCYMAMEGYTYFDGHGEISTDNTNGPRMIFVKNIQGFMIHLDVCGGVVWWWWAFIEFYLL